MNESPVSLRIWIPRAAFREIDRRADAMRAPREDVAAALVVQALGQPTQPMQNSAQVALSASTLATFADAVRAQPGLAPVLLRLLGDADH